MSNENKFKYSKFYKTGFQTTKQWKKNMMNPPLSANVAHIGRNHQLNIQTLDTILDRDQDIDKRFDDIISEFSLDHKKKDNQQWEQDNRGQRQIDRINYGSMEDQYARKESIIEDFQTPVNMLRRNQEAILTQQELKQIEQKVNGPEWKNYLTELMKNEDALGVQVQKEHLQPEIFQKLKQPRSKSPPLPIIQFENTSLASPKGKGILASPRTTIQSGMLTGNIKKIKFTPASNMGLSPDKMMRATKMKGLIKQDIVINIHALYRTFIEQTDILSNQSRVNILTEIMRQICSYESPYQEYLKFAFDEIHKFIFCNEEDIINAIKEMSFQDNEEISYLDVSRKLYNFIMKQRKTYDNYKQQLFEENKSYMLHIEQLSKEADISRDFTSKTIKNREQQFAATQIELEAEIQNYKKQLISLNQNIQELKENMYSMQDKNNQERQHSQQTFDAKLKELNVQVFDLKTRVEHLEEINENQRTLTDDYKQKFNTAFASLKFARDNIQRLQEKNFELENERSRLAVRAAVGFTELTPRPDFSSCYDLIGLDPDEIKEPKTTKLRVDYLYKLIYQKFVNKEGAISREKFDRRQTQIFQIQVDQMKEEEPQSRDSSSQMPSIQKSYQGDSMSNFNNVLQKQL